MWTAEDLGAENCGQSRSVLTDALHSRAWRGWADIGLGFLSASGCNDLTTSMYGVILRTM